MYYRFDWNLKEVASQGLIQYYFKSGPFEGIPSNLDAAFYEFHTKKIFFFKGERVINLNQLYSF